MSRAKLTATLAAVTSAVAVAVPAAGASAQTLPAYSPPAYVCAPLVSQIQWALAAGNPLLAGLISNTFIYVGCGGAAT